MWRRSQGYRWPTSSKKKGFTTAAFVSLGILNSSFGLNQGFDVYEDGFPADRWYLSAGEVNARVFPWLEQNKDRPFFLWIHYSDPHEPYAPPYMPSDLKLFLNDRPVYETSLQKYALNEVTLDLGPGKNRLHWELENEFDTDPDHFLGRLDRMAFDPPAAGQLKIDFCPGWFIRGTDNISFFKSPSIIEIDNRADLKQARLIFRGKPILPSEGSRLNYRREVEYMDGEIGRLWDKLSSLRLFETTAILLVGDHGEGLGEYRTDFGDPYFGHIHYIYDVFLKVPLLIRSPSFRKKGLIREEYVTMLDLAPTICKIMGLKPLSYFQGRHLLQPKNNERRLVLSETYRPESREDKFELLSFPWHLILTPEKKKYELFNLEEDPRERKNLAKDGEMPGEFLALKQKLDDFSRQALRGKQEIKFDEKTEEMLRALGYIR